MIVAPFVPVSPPLSLDSSGTGGHDQKDKAAIGAEEEIDLKDALFSDPIVGVEAVAISEHGPGALTPRPLSTPPSMTPAQRAIHNLTHLPYHPGCPICAATRRPNSPSTIAWTSPRRALARGRLVFYALRR